jgi:hypothetical protein
MILVTLLIGVLVLVLVIMAMGPLESLGWWSDKGAEKAAATIERLREEHARSDLRTSYSRYVVYLSGIGAIDGESRLPVLGEQPGTDRAASDVVAVAQDRAGQVQEPRGDARHAGEPAQRDPAVRQR